MRRLARFNFICLVFFTPPSKIRSGAIFDCIVAIKEAWLSRLVHVLQNLLDLIGLDQVAEGHKRGSVKEGNRRSCT